MVSLSNHLGFGGDGRFDGLRDRWATVGDLDRLRERMVSLSNHSGGWFGEDGRFDELSDRWG